MSDTPTPEPNAHLWRLLRGFIHACVSIFGAPAALAAAPFLARAEHVRVTSWIAMLEALLRRLLYLDAVALAPSPARAPRPPRPRAARSAHAFDPARPESWRAHFVLWPHAGGRAHTSAPTPPAYLPSAPLALRFEALVRVVSAPARHAQRFADFLVRQGRAVVAFVRKLGKWRSLRCPAPQSNGLAEVGWRVAAAGVPAYVDSS